jgi:hypothetical protein
MRQAMRSELKDHGNTRATALKIRAMPHAPA